jgi:poly(3-hydroxyalkanoate) depolymerase
MHDPAMTTANTAPLRARPLTRRIIEVEGQRLRVAVKSGADDGVPLLVFNGLGGEMRWLEPLAHALLDVEVVLFDVPGLGGSPAPRRPYSFADLARLADAMLTELGYDGAVDVLGLSWGGALAQQFARSCASRCHRLILAATSAGSIVIPGRWSTLLRLFDPNGGRSLAAEIRASVPLGSANDDSAHDDDVTDNVTGYRYQQLAMCGWTSLPWLFELRQPTLILAGTQDPLLHVANAQLLQCMIVDSELRLIEDGHLFVLTSAVMVASLIQEFLRRSGAVREARRVA